MNVDETGVLISFCIANQIYDHESTKGFSGIYHHSNNLLSNSLINYYNILILSAYYIAIIIFLQTDSKLVASADWEILSTPFLSVISTKGCRHTYEFKENFRLLRFDD